MIWKLANAFGYDIDFAQDLREGDSFSVIYDDVYREGEREARGEMTVNDVATLLHVKDSTVLCMIRFRQNWRQ